MQKILPWNRSKCPLRCWHYFLRAINYSLKIPLTSSEIRNLSVISGVKQLTKCTPMCLTYSKIWSILFMNTVRFIGCIHTSVFWHRDLLALGCFNNSFLQRINKTNLWNFVSESVYFHLSAYIIRGCAI